MKKITLLSAVLVAGMATAQVQMTAPENMEVRQVVATQSVEMDREITMEEWNAEYIAKQQKAAAEDYAAHDYYYVDGMMHWGLTPTFMSMAYDFIAIPYMESVVWKNLYGPTDWYDQYDDELLAEDSETLVAEGWYGIDGVGYFLPYTTDHTLTQNGVDYLIKGYKFAAGNENGGLLASGAAPFTISTGENIPITLCGMATDPMDNNNGSDFYRIGAGDRGAYAYGTDLIADLATGKTADTIISTVRNVSPLKISSVSIPVYNTNGTAIMPEGAEVKIEIIAADLKTGKIYTDSILATAVATPADFVDVQSGLGTIVGRFYEEDPFGGMMEVAVVVEGDFVTRVTGYNESGCDFGIYADYYTPGGTTVYQVNSKYTPIFNASSNLAIMYDAYWPVVECGMGSEILVAPVAGGVAMDGEYQAFALYTNVYDIEGAWIISDETSEWLEFALDASTLETEGYIVAQITAEALPAGMTGRKGAVVIDADGYKLSIPVLQGETTGVENVVTPSIKDNKRYNLLGVEVDENYNGVVIMNGKKYIQ